MSEKTLASSKWKQYCYGVKRALPVILGFVPVAITFAILATEASMTRGETVAMSMAVFAGASQIMAVDMLASGLWSVVLATLVLNLRHIMMSTCVFRRMHSAKLWQKIIASFGVTDESFALFTSEENESVCTPWFMFGIITVTYSSWVGGTILGVFLTVLLPEVVKNSFGIALSALFLALLVPDLKKSGKLLLTVLLTAGLNYGLVFLFGSDSGWPVIGSTLLGAALGSLWMTPKKEKEGTK